MATKFSSFCVLVVFLAATTAFLAEQTHGVPDLCARSKNPVLCRDIVKGCSEPIPALKSAIKFLKKETKAAKRLAHKSGRSQEIDVCIEMFDTTLDDLDQGMTSIKTRDTNSLRTFMSSAMSNVVTCDDTFTEAGKKFPLGPTDKRLSQIVSILLYLSALVH